LEDWGKVSALVFHFILFYFFPQVGLPKKTKMTKWLTKKQKNTPQMIELNHFQSSGNRICSCPVLADAHSKGASHVFLFGKLDHFLS
jgi:hypothetical protein